MTKPTETPDAATDAAEFLTSLGHLLSTVGLYPEDHPARAESVRACWEDLQRLLKHGEPVFSFLDDVVLFGHIELRDLRSWDLGCRLYGAGIQRLELGRGVEFHELERVVEHVRSRLFGSDPEASEKAMRGLPHVRLGSVTVRVDPAEDEEGIASNEPVRLDEELEAVRWTYGEAVSDRLPKVEVCLAVESLSLAMDSLRRSGSELIAIKSRDQYTAIHCMNVAILSMTLAERVGFRPEEIRLIGEAALLHDIGKTKTPDEILNKPGVLTPDERRIIEEHTIEGCRLVLESRPRGSLAATVAYEHHMGNGGRGYPQMHYDREPHPVSRLVQVCDVYDALRTRRPFRPPMGAQESLQFLTKRAGSYFHRGVVEAFIVMVRDLQFQTPRVRPQVSAVEQAERQAAKAARRRDSGTLSERLDAMAESLLAPEPDATVDWLEIL